jgi:replication factor A2
VNVYVRVTGPLKSFGGKTHIAINSLSAVEDHNEILFHAVEVVYTHLRITKGDVRPLPFLSSPALLNLVQPIANGGGGGHAAGGQTGANNPYAAKASTTADKDDSGEYSTLPLLQRKIMEFVAGLGDETPEEGVHIREIHRQAGGTVPFERFETEITQLIDDGQLYTTIDDDQ